MKDEKRMTLDQFVRNNRGINDGADLPIEFLTNLYHEIKVSFPGEVYYFFLLSVVFIVLFVCA